MKVDYIDLSVENKEIYKKISSKIEDIVAKSDFILGKAVIEFENNFASFIGSKYALGLASGTDGILLSLMTLGVGKGDEVLVPAFTFTASVTPIIQLGAKPVLVDILPNSPLIDPDLLEKSITKKTKAIIIVHLHGMVCDMDSITKIAKKYSLPLIEDCSQAHGASWKGKIVGSFGDFGVFSFYPTKNMGAFGDAGAVTTSNKSHYKLLQTLRNHGQTTKNVHEFVGMNSRLDSIQAVVLNQKLKEITLENKIRVAIVKTYIKALKEVSIIATNLPEALDVYHVFAIIVQKRDKLKKFLEESGIGTGLYYPLPIHEQIFYKKLYGSSMHYKNSENFAHNHLCLPLYSRLQDKQVDYVIKKTAEFLKS